MSRDIPAYTNSESLNLSWTLHDLREHFEKATRNLAEMNPQQRRHYFETVRMITERVAHAA